MAVVAVVFAAVAAWQSPPDILLVSSWLHTLNETAGFTEVTEKTSMNYE